MENLRMRTRKEVSNAGVYSIQKFAKDLLTTADTLDIALTQTPPHLLSSADKEPSATLEETSKALQNLHSGIVLTQKSLLTTLSRYGITPYTPLNEQFNPNLHEALFRTSVPGKKAGEVFVVSQCGWMIHDRVVRAAQVGVVRDEEE